GQSALYSKAALRRSTPKSPSFITSTLSNSVNGLGDGPASESLSAIVRCRAEFSPPRISGQRERNAGVTFLGTCPNAAGRIATSSSLKSGTGSNAGSSIKLKNVTVAQLVQHRATFTSCDGNPQWGDCSLLLRAVAREVSNAVRLDCLCRRDVGIAAGCIALLELGKSASIERTRQLRIESQPIVDHCCYAWNTLIVRVSRGFPPHARRS